MCGLLPWAKLCLWFRPFLYHKQRASLAPIGSKWARSYVRTRLAPKPTERDQGHVPPERKATIMGILSLSPNVKGSVPIQLGGGESYFASGQKMPLTQARMLELILLR